MMMMLLAKEYFLCVCMYVRVQKKQDVEITTIVATLESNPTDINWFNFVRCTGNSSRLNFGVYTIQCEWYYLLIYSLEKSLSKQVSFCVWVNVFCTECNRLLKIWIWKSEWNKWTYQLNLAEMGISSEQHNQIK